MEVKETHKIRNISDHEQSLLIKDSPLFAERIYRLYQVKDGVDEFRETMGEKVNRSGTASSIVSLQLEGEVAEHYNNEVKIASASSRLFPHTSSSAWKSSQTLGLSGLLKIAQR